jgi:hypothetical protein
MFDLTTEIIDQKTQIAEDEKSASQSCLITLRGSFSSCGSSYQFEIRSDGTGMIFYCDSFPGEEEFAHEVEVEKLADEIREAVNFEVKKQFKTDVIESSEIESIAKEITAEKLEEVFWEQINQTLEDPFFRSFDDESEWGEEFYCEQGNESEFEEFLELCVLTEKQISDPEDYLVIYTETECDAAGLSDCSYYSERLGELVEIACGYFKPVGHRYDYNDGYYDRYSGYSMSSESISISLKESAKTTAREKMLGMLKLREKLSAMNVANDVIVRLTAF